MKLQHIYFYKKKSEIKRKGDRENEREKKEGKQYNRIRWNHFLSKFI